MNFGRGKRRYSVLLGLGLILLAIIGRAAPPIFDATTSNWQFGPMGNALGLYGFDAVQVNGGTELVFGTLRTGSGNSDDSWQVLRWDPFAGGIRQVYASQQYPAAELAIVRVLDVNDDGKPEIVIGRSRGLDFYDAATKALLGRLDFGESLLGWTEIYMDMADYDQDGDRDLLILTPESLYLVEGLKNLPNGQIWISELTGVGGHRFFVGQLDDDAPLEILFTWGGVIEVGSWKEEWQLADLNPSFLVRGLIDRDGDGISEILVTTTDQVITLDLSSKAEIWRTQVDAYLPGSQFQAAQLDGDPAFELVFAHQKLVVVDSATGATESTTVLPPAAFLGLADVDGDGGMDVVLREGARFTSEQMRIVRASDGSSLWSSHNRGSHFDSPKLGDIDGDGQPELVLGGRRPAEFLGSTPATGLITLVNPATSQPIAQFEVPDGYRVLDVADADGDGCGEILVGGEAGTPDAHWWKRRDLRVYKYSNGELAITWQKTVADIFHPDADHHIYKTGKFVDLNGDGAMEIVAGWTLRGDDHHGRLASGIEAWDLATGAVIWASPRQSLEFSAMCVGNLDKDAAPEVAAIFGEKWLRVWDLKTGRQEFKLRGAFTCVSPMAGGFVAGQRSGHISRFKARRSGSARFARTTHERISKKPVAGITADIGGTALWIAIHNQFLWWPGKLKHGFIIQGDEDDGPWDPSSVRPEVALTSEGGWMFATFGRYGGCVRGFYLGQ